MLHTLIDFACAIRTLRVYGAKHQVLLGFSCAVQDSVILFQSFSCAADGRGRAD